MTVEFIRRRITEIRREKGVTEYKMSRDLGHSKGYIQSIASGKIMPSFSELFRICDYLGIPPRALFDECSKEPVLVAQLLDICETLPAQALRELIHMAQQLETTTGSDASGTRQTDGQG